MKYNLSQKIKKEKDRFNNNIYNEDYSGYETNVYNPIKSEYEELPEISPENIYDYLEDNYERDEEEEFREERIKEDLGIGVETIEEPPLETPAMDVPEFSTTEDAMDWAGGNGRVARINYVTKKGTSITRLVEPHGKFVAQNGNTILVTYDQTIGGIRAFITGNIANYIISGDNFNPKFKVTQKRGIKNMSNKIFQDLQKVGNDLELLKMQSEAETVTKVMRNFLNIKTAQYVGVQGYWVRNKRCFDNCYRQKRAQNKETPAQEIWFDCQKEYEKSINDDNSGWEKYAELGSPLVKTAEGQQKYILEREDKFFKAKVKEGIKNNMPFPNAVYASLDQGFNRYGDQILDDTNKLLDVANGLKEKGQNDLAQKIADISIEMMKEAQWWQKAKDIGRGAWEGAKNVGRGAWEEAKNLGEKAKEQMGQWEQAGQQSRVIPAIQKTQQYLQNLKSVYSSGWLKEVDKVNQMIVPIAQISGSGAQAAQIVSSWDRRIDSIDGVVQQLSTVLSQAQTESVPEPVEENQPIGDWTQSVNVAPDVGSVKPEPRKTVTPVQNYRMR